MVGITPVTMTTATVETVTPSVIAEMNRHIESKSLLHCTCSQAKYCSQKHFLQKHIVLKNEPIFEKEQRL